MERYPDDPPSCTSVRTTLGIRGRPRLSGVCRGQYAGLVHVLRHLYANALPPSVDSTIRPR